MQMNKLFAILIPVVLLSGCATTQERSKVLTAGKTKYICVVEDKIAEESSTMGRQYQFDKTSKYNVLESIEEGLTKHGVKYRVIPGDYNITKTHKTPTYQEDQSAGCDTFLFYRYRFGKIDALVPVTVVEGAGIWLMPPGPYPEPGPAYYDARLGFVYFRFDNKPHVKHPKASVVTQELIDELFAEYKSTKPAVQGNAASKPAPTATNSNNANANPISQRLRELQNLRKEGLISDEDYQKKKKQLLDQL